ncbi:MAG: hypothetical protein J7J72_08320 [Bacteroidales bacterium]|nr:hypothetical protein [Bacteroidales bacterium]
MIKRILYITFWVLSVLALLSFEVYALRKNGNTPCKKLSIELKNKNNYPLLTSPVELRTELLENHDPIEGQKIKNLNLEHIENNVGQIAYLKNYNTYFTIDGDLVLKASPRKAIMRVYNQAGQHFYLGEDNVVMPLSSQHRLRLLLANGALPKLKMDYFKQSRNDTLVLPDIYKKIYILAAKIQKDEFLNALIDEIYIKTNQEIELIPKTGVNYIEFGDTNNLENKLKRLKIFYIKGKEKIDWSIYKSINLEYKNQVVCTKK